MLTGILSRDFVTNRVSFDKFLGYPPDDSPLADDAVKLLSEVQVVSKREQHFRAKLHLFTEEAVEFRYCVLN